MLPNNNNNHQCLPLLLHPQFLPYPRGLLPLPIALTRLSGQCRPLQLGKSSLQLSFKP
jgi:hypothetical protein